MKTCLEFFFVLLVGSAAVPALAQPSLLRLDQAEFRSLYKELVETNTTLSAGSCTLAAERMASHLSAAGFLTGDLRPFADPAHPKEGGLVVIYPGRDPKARRC